MSEVKAETSEERRARIFARMRQDVARKGGLRKEKQKTRKDLAAIDAAYGRWVDEYYDGMTLEEMKDFDMNSIGGTKRAAFIDVMVQKIQEDAEEKAKAAREAEESIVDELANPDDQAIDV